MRLPQVVSAIIESLQLKKKKIEKIKSKQLTFNMYVFWYEDGNKRGGYPREDEVTVEDVGINPYNTRQHFLN